MTLRFHVLGREIASLAWDVPDPAPRAGHPDRPRHRVKIDRQNRPRHMVKEAPMSGLVLIADRAQNYGR
jgi:hypothetical protein